MSNDAKELVVREAGAPPPVDSMENWKLMMAQADTYIKSGYLPKAITTPAQVVAIIMAGQEYGFKPWQSLRSINIINGQPTLCAEGQVALVFDKIPGAVINLIESTDEVATYEAQRPGGKMTTLSFTMEQAKGIRVKKRNGSWGNLVDGLAWKNYKAAMLRARCASAICRVVFPDATRKLYTPEELGAEVNADGEVLELPSEGVPEIDAPPVVTAPDVPQPGEFTHDHEPTVADAFPGATDDADDMLHAKREREPGEDDEPPPHEDPDEGAGQPPANAPSTKQVKFFQKLEADLIDEVGAEQAVETLTAIQKERGLPVTCAPKNVYEKRQMSKLIDGLLAALGRG